MSFMNIPYDKNLDTKILSQIYSKTVATYKFYWFVSMLDIFVKKQERVMSFWEIVSGMIAEAWYPIQYFKSHLANQILCINKSNYLRMN